MNFIQSFSKEALFALVLGLVTTKLISQRKAIAPIITTAHHTPPKLIDVKEAFTDGEISDLTSVWQDEKPQGNFVKGRHGITHYVFERSDDATKSQKGMVVLAHGLGASLKGYTQLADILVNKGFAVLRYDCFGHGYSKYDGEDMWMKYTPDMFVDQLEDLLDFVFEQKEEEVVAYVGHSNGGVNAISANFRWSSNESNRRVFPKIIFLAPAIYAKKPILAQISDSIPRVMVSLMKSIPAMKSLIGDNYLELMTQVFGKDSETNEYRFPEAYKKSMDSNLRLFGRVDGTNEHPFLAAAILGVSCYNIPSKMLPMHRDRLLKLLKDKESNHLFVWGDLDVTVPFKNYADQIRKLSEDNDNLKFEILENISHELLLEDSNAVAKVVLPFLESN